MPAHTAVRLAAYSSGPTCGKVVVFAGVFFLVRGKLPHRLRDLRRAGHEELLLRGVERHCRDVWRGDAVESMRGDDGCDSPPDPAGDVVLVNDHRLAGLANRFEDRVTVERRQTSQVDHLDAHAFGVELLGGLQAVVRHEAPGKTAQLGSLTAYDRGPDRHEVIAVGDLLSDKPISHL